MSNTRRARLDDKRLHQNRYSSSPEFETGLMGNLVARRATLVDDPKLREFLLILQYWSHQEGGLKAYCKELADTFPKRFQSVEMRRIGIKPGRRYKGTELERIAHDFDSRHGVLPAEVRGCPRFCDVLLEDWLETNQAPESLYVRGLTGAQILKEVLECARHLPRLVEEICLNPKLGPEDFNPPYLPDFVQTVFDHQEQRAARLFENTVDTEVRRRVFEAIEMAEGTRSVVMVEGRERTGKSWAARAFCHAYPGRFRLVEVPSCHDDKAFFRQLARALGTSCTAARKALEVRERAEEMLWHSGLTVVCDESQFLLPATNRRETLPRRVNWIMTALSNHEVPAVLIATPQLMEDVGRVERQTGWRSGQFLGRLLEYVRLNEPGRDDLWKLARFHFPEGSEDAWEALADYALVSKSGVAGISKILLMIRHRKGGEKIGERDILKAIRDRAMPSDTALSKIVSKDSSKRLVQRKRQHFVDDVEPSRQTSPTPANPTRNISPITSGQLRPSA